MVLILICSAISVGFYTATDFDGAEEYDKADPYIKKQWPRPNEHQVMIFWWVRYYGGRVIPYFWTKPLYSCLPCMGSFHSIAPTVTYCYYSGMPLIIWPFVALATVGLNKLITIWWSR
jgi:hypothetical protein